MSLGKQTKTLLIKLVAMRDSGVISPHGICAGLDGNSSRIFQKLRRSWPHYREGMSAAIFSGTNDEARLHLLNWAIADLQKRDNSGLSTLLFSLKNIRNSDDKANGICRYLGRESKMLFVELYKGWPKYSGDEMFPVPSPSVIYSNFNAFHILPKWTGKYGKLRLELLDWSITQLEMRCGS